MTEEEALAQIAALEDQIAGREQHIIELEDLLKRWKSRHADLQQVLRELHCANCGYRPWAGEPDPKVMADAND